ncbi:MAG: YraN family protein [Tissierellia bacterium]|nr:YraN family protein [Tissierellia bacterium]
MGEEIASRYLKHKGYTILNRNYASRHGEIDLIAFHNMTLVFVEVKTRKNYDYIYACESVNYQKQTKIKLTANKYLAENLLYFDDIRFDVIECYWQSKQVNHIENAF